MKCLFCGSQTQEGLIHEGKVVCPACLEKLSEDLPLKKIYALIEYTAYLEDAKLLLGSAARFDFATDDVQRAISVIDELLGRVVIPKLSKIRIC